MNRSKTMAHRHLLLLGDSLIEFYDWQARFPGEIVRNLGIAGESVEGLLARMPAIATQPGADFILVMSGTNNLAMENYFFIAAYEKILTALKNRFPEAAVVINSLLPFQLPWLSSTAIPRTNAALKQLACDNNVSFLDAYPAFVDPQGNPILDYFLDDGVHLSDQGYAAWSSLVAQRFATLFPPDIRQP